MVCASHDHGPRWRACGGGVEICETQAILSKLVDVGRVDLRPEATYIRKPKVICNDNEEVGPLGNHFYVYVV